MGFILLSKRALFSFVFSPMNFLSSKKEEKKEHISPFGALMISTASRVGIGNIVGVGLAISLGGVGALFWMWVVAIVGGQVPL